MEVVGFIKFRSFVKFDLRVKGFWGGLVLRLGFDVRVSYGG